MSTDPTDGPVTEQVDLFAAPGHEQQLEDAVRAAVPLFQNSTGATSMVLRRQHEDAAHYTLLIGWEHLDDHLVGFRESPAFGQWRELVGPHLAQAPQATHHREVFTGF